MKDLVGCKNMDFQCPLLKIEEIDCEMNPLKHGQSEPAPMTAPVGCSVHRMGSGQSELTATNAPVGRSVHWMGCVFSFDAGWGSSQSISF